MSDNPFRQLWGEMKHLSNIRRDTSKMESFDKAFSSEGRLGRRFQKDSISSKYRRENGVDRRKIGKAVIAI